MYRDESGGGAVSQEDEGGAGSLAGAQYLSHGPPRHAQGLLHTSHTTNSQLNSNEVNLYGYLYINLFIYLSIYLISDLHPELCQEVY